MNQASTPQTALQKSEYYSSVSKLRRDYRERQTQKGRRVVYILAPGGTTEKNPQKWSRKKINNEFAEMICPGSSGCAQRGSGRNPATLQQREPEEHGGISLNPTRFSQLSAATEPHPAPLPPSLPSPFV